MALSDSIRKYTLDDDIFYEHINEMDINNLNLGLSKVNYSLNGVSYTETFDNLRERYNLDKIDILVIDTETQDLQVLHGFIETIKTLEHKPFIQFESNWWCNYSHSEAKILLDTFCMKTGYTHDIQDLNQRGDFYLYPPTTETNNLTTGPLDIELYKEYLINIDKVHDFEKFVKYKHNPPVNNVTLVTGLWDLGRGQLNGWAQRNFEIYKRNFFDLLKCDIPMCIWIPKELEADVWKIRSPRDTKVYIREVEDFKTWFPFFDEINEIRTSASWRARAGWLPDSPQGALEMYNPMMMTKMFMVNDSAIMNPFNTEYFYWIDGGITSTVPQHLLLNGDVFRNVPKVYDDTLVHITYPYEASTEIHGFEKYAFYKHCGLTSDTKEVLISRGGFWGGRADRVHEYNSIYYNILTDTIQRGLVGADECLFTIAAYKNPDLIDRFIIDSNGLIYPFFEQLKNPEEVIKTRIRKPLNSRTAKNIIYVLGFNSPKQFDSICQSIVKTDTQFFEKSRKILINNSTDDSTFDEYDNLCELYQFEEIHTNNTGVCGGRQFAAEHFNMTGADFYMFFEDDMHLNAEDTVGDFCKSGFRKYVPNLYDTVIKIMLKENFDFLKFSFSEFYGENSVQWAWYNVPQTVRTNIWPEYDKLPEVGLDPNCPKTQFSNIKFLDEIPYITGEIYYSNWPQIVSREGNKKMFLTTKWERPFEQTWMSHMFQLSRNKELSSAVLLASPVHHERFDFYDGSLRKES